MTEATWGGAASTDLDWRMSAALENVPRGGNDVAEVTSLEGAVRAWSELDAEHRQHAVFTPERAIQLDGALVSTLTGDGIAALADRLPARRDGD